MLALFNKFTKEFIGYSKEDLPEQFYKTVLTKEIPQDKVDISKWAWSGDYDNGKMISLNPIKNEDDENYLFQKLYREYPLDLQVAILVKQVRDISEKTNCLRDDFKNMSNLLLKAIEKIII